MKTLKEFLNESIKLDEGKFGRTLSNIKFALGNHKNAKNIDINDLHSFVSDIAGDMHKPGTQAHTAKKHELYDTISKTQSIHPAVRALAKASSLSKNESMELDEAYGSS